MLVLKKFYIQYADIKLSFTHSNFIGQQPDKGKNVTVTSPLRGPPNFSLLCDCDCERQVTVRLKMTIPLLIGCDSHGETTAKGARESNSVTSLAHLVDYYIPRGKSSKLIL